MKIEVLICIPLYDPPFKVPGYRLDLLPRHVTLIPPFEVEQLADSAQTTYFRRAENVTGVVKKAASCHGPDVIRFTGARYHPNAKETKFVVSLQAEGRLLDAMREQLVVDLPAEQVNPNHLFPFHVSIESDIATEQEAKDALGQVEREFGCCSASVGCINVHWRPKGEKPWRLLASFPFRPLIP